MYEYDASGRLVTVITPTGSRLDFDSRLGDMDGKKHLSVHSAQSTLYGNVESNHRSFVLSILDESAILFNHGECILFSFF